MSMLTISLAKKAALLRWGLATALVIALGCSLAPRARAQSDCAEGNGTLNTDPPKDVTAEQLIQKFAAQESKVKQAIEHYTHTQDVLVQTLGDKGVDGQFHEISTVSYDDKGKRAEKVTYAEQSTLRQVALTQEDLDDIRIFMPWILTTEEVAQYKVSYSGQQHVDDLDTYVFHVDPKKEEKNRRYFRGKIWVDNRDFQIVKLCGKSVPDLIRPKKHQPMDVRPTFVGYRQFIDGAWLPAYARVDDTIQFQVQSVHVREIVKFKDYKKAGTGTTTPKP